MENAGGSGKDAPATAPPAPGGGLTLSAEIAAANKSPGCTNGYDAVVGQLHLVAGPGCNQKLIVALHGGAWAFGKAADMNGFIGLMKAAGIIYVSLEYSLGVPMGQILDEVAYTLKVLRVNAAVVGFDTNKMGVMGFSAGGHLAMMGGIADGNVRWIGSISGPPDLIALETNMCAKPEHADLCQHTRTALGGTAAQKAENYRLYSPLDNIGGLVNFPHAPTFYIAQGDSDELVPVASGDRMNEGLAAIGVPVAYYRIAGGDHIGTYTTVTPQVIAHAAATLETAPNPPARAADGAKPAVASSEVRRATLHRCYNAQSGAANYVLDTAQCGSGFAADGMTFDVVDGVAGTAAIFLYTNGRFNYGLTVGAAAGSGLTQVGPLGHLYVNQEPGTVPINICVRDTDNNQILTKTENCEGVSTFRKLGTLGYGF